jgi:hypothetical protein
MTLQFGRMAVGGGKLYFDGLDSTISSVPLPNGALKPDTFSDTKSVVSGMVADEEQLYWTDYNRGAVVRCPHSGCKEPEVIAAGQVAPHAIVQDAVSIYWASNDVDGAPIQRLAK